MSGKGSNIVFERGFTLMEIMIALAILAVSLVAVLQMQAQSLDGAARNKGLTVATLLARSKLIDVEQKLAEDGPTLNDQVMDGTFREEGHPEIKWEAAIKPVQLDISSLLQFCSFFDGAGGKGAKAPPKPAPNNKAPNKAGVQSPPPMDCESMVGGLTGILGPFVDEISQSVRAIVLKVQWPRGRYQESMEVRSLWIREDLATQQAAEAQRQLNQAVGDMGVGGAGVGAGGLNNPPGGLRR